MMKPPLKTEVQPEKELTHEEYVEQILDDIRKSVKSINTAVSVFFVLFLLSIIVGACNVIFG